MHIERVANDERNRRIVHFGKKAENTQNNFFEKNKKFKKTLAKDIAL